MSERTAIVVDASALVKYLLREEGWELVSNAIRAQPLYTVDHAIKEVANALWKHHARGLADRDVVLKIWRAFGRLIEAEAVVVEDERRYVEPALGIALRDGITVYDALYIAQSIEKNAKLLTADMRQAEVAKAHNVSTIIC
ncbi:MAG: type II toxin-antitoxin system VapC family toxin [Thermoproteus sp.]